MERIRFDEEWGVSESDYNPQRGEKTKSAKFMDALSRFILSSIKLTIGAAAVLVASTFIHLSFTAPYLGPYYEAFMEGLTGESAGAYQTPGPTPTWEEWQEKAEEVPYRTLFRHAEEYNGKSIYFRGKIVQVLESEEEEGNFQLRVNVTPPGDGSLWWTDTVYLFYRDAPVRVLEDDIVAFVGRGAGVLTYTSVEDVEITIPALVVQSLIIEEEESGKIKFEIDKR